jgi:hypothetical protein
MRLALGLEGVVIHSIVHANDEDVVAALLSLEIRRASQ